MLNLTLGCLTPTPTSKNWKIKHKLGFDKDARTNLSDLIIQLGISINPIEGGATRNHIFLK
jgi:hypothetical protein